MDTVDATEMLVEYVKAGIGVFPLHGVKDGRCTCGYDCASPAKHPFFGLAHRKGDPLRETCHGACGRIGHGLYDATTDLGVLSEWLGSLPTTCNWGIRPPLGVIVLDVDPRNDGHVNLAELERKHGLLPGTMTAQTGSGGLHHWLTYNGPTRGKLCEGVDIKSNTGYVVAPPSLHICGGRYFWLDQRPAAYAPDWVKARMNPPVRLRPQVALTNVDKAKVAAGLIAYVEKADGAVNDAVYWAACRADEHGILDELLEQLVTAAAAAASVKGKASEGGEHQTRKSIDSARRRPPRRASVASQRATSSILGGAR